MTTLSFGTIRAAILNAETVGDFPYGSDHSQDRCPQRRCAPYLQVYLAEVRRDAACAAGSVPDLPFSTFKEFWVDGDRLSHKRPYFTLRYQVLALALHALLDGTHAHRDATENYLWSTCDEFTWALPAHLPKPSAHDRRPADTAVDLFAAETAALLMEVVFLLGERLDPWVKALVSENVKCRVLSMFDSAGHYGWEAALHNWAGTNNTSPRTLDFLSIHGYAVFELGKCVEDIYNRTYRPTNSGIPHHIRDLRALLNEESPSAYIPLVHGKYNIAANDCVDHPNIRTHIGAVYDALTLVGDLLEGADWTAAWNEKVGIFGKMDNSLNRRPAIHTFQLFNSYLRGRGVSCTQNHTVSLVCLTTVDGTRRSAVPIYCSPQQKARSVFSNLPQSSFTRYEIASRTTG